MNPPVQKSETIIIGGGFAGLAAALRLHQRGQSVRLIEKRPFFGGRAYSLKEPKTGQVVDNGQHLLMGAYHETLQFLEALGTRDLLYFQPGLKVSMAESGKVPSTLSCPNLPAPFHLAFGLLGFGALNFRDKRGMARLMRFVKKLGRNGQELDALSVSQLLERTGQTERSTKVFWEPLGLATLNEGLDEASAQLFIEVLKQGLLQKKADSKLIFPKVGFSDLYAKPAQAYFERHQVPIHFQTQVEQIVKTPEGWQVATRDGGSYNGNSLILAVPPNALDKILDHSDAGLRNAFPKLEPFQSSPIVSINLWFEKFDIPMDFVGLVDSPIHWIFNKSKIFSKGSERYFSLVVSGAKDLAAKSKDELVTMALEEFKRFFPNLNESPKHSQVIKEYEATYHGRLGQESLRPKPKTSLPGLYLAGDWIQTGLPATIESAVKSGHQAADLILESAP